MDKTTIKKQIAGDPARHVAGLQDDWWTEIAPDLWGSHGSYLKDLSGTEYLDLCGFFSSAPIRYDHPRLRSDDFIRDIGRVATYRTTLGDFWTTEFAAFVDTLRRVATPSYMHHYFFIDGGALAVENALKAAFDWKVRMNMKKGKISGDPQEDPRPLGTKILHFERAFHGRSGYTLSLTHTHDPNKYKYFPKFDWFRVEAPFKKFNTDGTIANQDELDQQLKEAASHVKTILEQHGDDIAAMLFEPIQCEGGDRHVPAEFFIKMRELADAYDVLLIFDEVQTGFGTTGAMWGHEHFGNKARPDLIAFSKKSQVGGIMANYDKFAKIKDNVFGNHDACKSRLNSTWGGHPVDMMRAHQVLLAMEEENLLENAQTMGQRFLTGLQDLCRHHSDMMSNPRGLGLLLGFDAATPEIKGKIWSAFKNEGLLALMCGEKTVRFRPHLDITPDEVDEALIRMERGLSKL